MCATAWRERSPSSCHSPCHPPLLPPSPPATQASEHIACRCAHYLRSDSQQSVGTGKCSGLTTVLWGGRRTFASGFGFGQYNLHRSYDK